MSTGTSGSYWAAQALPSVFKHNLLGRYIPQFGGMTGSRDKRVVYLDGYAGEGRYENGDPGSAEIAMRVASKHRSQHRLHWTCFFTEADAKSVARLETVAGIYRGQGVDARVHHGEVDGVLDQVVCAATGQPLFLFLDPCGLGLPYGRLVGTMAARRRTGTWPPTEFLMNFSMDAVRRLGGNARSAKGVERSSQRFDEVMGGPWWRKYFPAGREPDPGADEAVAAEYARRLAAATGMLVRSVPVARAPHHKPVYHLVFGTRRQHGLWVFGDTVARARDTWWEKLEVADETKDPDSLFTVASLIRPDPKKVTEAAVPEIAKNLERLLAEQRRPFRLVDHTLEVFGDYYGQVTEPAVRAAVKQLHADGKTPSTGVSRNKEKIRDLVVAPAQ
ncbi:three-Cys-motif partner protein TcmP [Streptomyces acidicola]|uniref:Three-Cys-motif partner protein TcmP n=1 Tax=Streptomyces acidicola TaxID=2596892 RepID=A0A5N8X3U4_9ACTN|nr:three-Cys-motif partner protein TcmP [Streptomyces acidicola]MPY54247.1 three-Cys-motif partner protein TcmP [Streptomyces acidicola]